MNYNNIHVITHNGRVTSHDVNNYQCDLGNHKLKDCIFLHKAQNNREFILRFLWLLKNNIAQGILSEKILDHELKNIQNQLGEHFLYVDNTLQYIKSPKKNIHPEARLILFTSGSSGTIKGVQLSSQNIQANTKAVIETLDFKTVKNQILFLPLHYSFGLLGQLLPALELGVCTYLLNHLLEAKDILTNYTDCMISGVPQHYQTLSKLYPQESFPSITHVVSAGAYWSIPDRLRTQQLFPQATLFNNYGQTELSPRALSISSKDPFFFQGVTGKVVPGLEAKISDDGELLFRGKQVMLGYIDDNNQKTRPHSWWHTGDNAILVEGNFMVNGRKDDIIKINGERTSILSINNKIKEVPQIIDAFTMNEKDTVQDHYLITFIVTAKDFMLEQFKKDLSASLMPSFIPKKIYKIEHIPLLPNGKIDRQGIKNNLDFRSFSLI